MTIRLRLALLYTAILGICLVAFGGWFISSTTSHLLAETDDALREWAAITAERIPVVVASPRGDAPSIGVLPHVDVFKLPGLHVQILDPSARLQYCSESLGGQRLPVDHHALDIAQGGKPAYYTARQNGSKVRVYVLPVRNANGEVVHIVQVGRTMQHIDYTNNVMKRLALVGIVLFAVMAGALSYAATSKALRPVAVLTSTARAIAKSGEFGRRVDGDDSSDELGRLASAFNEMLSSLEATGESRRRFLADASHELRSPLTSIINNIDFLMRARDASGEERSDALVDMAADADRMRRLVAQLLYLARTDSSGAVPYGDVDLSALVSEEFRSFKSMAASRDYHLDVQGGLVVHGDVDALRQAVRALIENAIKYSEGDGRVHVSLAHRDALAILTVQDDGIGVSPSEGQLIFDRFYRGSRARMKDPMGAGLGLSIAMRVAQLHHGRLAVEPGLGGKGSRFTLSLPMWSVPDVGDGGDS